MDAGDFDHSLVNKFSSSSQLAINILIHDVALSLSTLWWSSRLSAVTIEITLHELGSPMQREVYSAGIGGGGGGGGCDIVVAWKIDGDKYGGGGGERLGRLSCLFDGADEGDGGGGLGFLP